MTWLTYSPAPFVAYTYSNSRSNVMSRIVVYNLESKNLESRFNGTEYRLGDIYLFRSGSSQTCFRCWGSIPSGASQIIQRRRSSDGTTEWNDRYHLNCCPGWLVEPVSRLMEET